MPLRRVQQLFKFGIRGVLNDLRSLPHLDLHLRTAPSVDGRFSFDVPIAKCRNIIQQKYDDDENPFVRTACLLIESNREGAAAILRDYYARNQPDSLYACFYHSRLTETAFDAKSKQHLPYLIIPPWDAMRRRNPGRIAHKKSVHPLIGPHNDAEILFHLDRLQAVSESVKQHGYQPNIFGHIQGHVLDRGDDAVFVVTSGKHRAAVLAAMGMERIPVSFKRNMPQAFCLGQSSYWPNVVNAMYSLEEAESIFNGFFQQSDCRETDKASGASAS